MSRVSSVVGAICLALLVGCSESGTPSETTASTVVSTAPMPIVEQISAAIAALETKLGGPQDYFEINATAQLINLFVALDDATSVQPHVYLDGELTADDAQPATGGVFRALDLDFDPSKMFATLQSELPGATIESFYIHGDGQGSVQYAALLTTSQGGAFEVQLDPDGQIIASEPLN